MLLWQHAGRLDLRIVFIEFSYWCLAARLHANIRNYVFLGGLVCLYDLNVDEMRLGLFKITNKEFWTHCCPLLFIVVGSLGQQTFLSGSAHFDWRLGFAVLLLRLLDIHWEVLHESGSDSPRPLLFVEVQPLINTLQVFTFCEEVFCTRRLVI